MIQDVVAIRDRDTRRLEFRDRMHNAMQGQIAFRVIVQPNNQDARMMPLCHEDQVVQLLKIPIVFREKDTRGTERVG
jgi:hypothetical protein